MLLPPAVHPGFRSSAWRDATKQQEIVEKCGDLMGAEGFFFSPFFPSIFEIQIECNFQLI